MKILDILSREKYVSGNEIGRVLNISRAAVHKQIKHLRNNGFIIDSSAKGYRLVKIIPAFNPEDVFKRFSAPVSICRKIEYFKKTNSTQIKLKSMAANGEPEGWIIIAEEQGASYGRMNRHWSSMPGGLWFSILLRPKISPEKVPLISLLTGLSLNRVLKNNYNADSKIKWTNDILCRDKKIAGVIIEMSAEQDIVNWISVGIGVNAGNKLPDDLTDAAALNEILKIDIDRAELLALFLLEFERVYEVFKKTGFAEFVPEYNENIAYMDEDVTIDSGFGIINGVNKGINEDGRLVIETEKGFEKVISGTLRRSQ